MADDEHRFAENLERIALKKAANNEVFHHVKEVVDKKLRGGISTVRIITARHRKTPQDTHKTPQDTAKDLQDTTRDLKKDACKVIIAIQGYGGGVGGGVDVVVVGGGGGWGGGGAFFSKFCFFTIRAKMQ